MVARWVEAVRSVGSALLEVLAAEAGALQRDLLRSGRELRGGLILLGLAAGLAFWTIGLGIWVAVEILALRLPMFGAGLVVFGVGVLACLILAWFGRRRLRRIEMPIDAVKRRSREHAEWWQQSVLPGLGVETPDRSATRASRRDTDDEGEGSP